MYGENGHLLRAELSSLLKQHRIQLRIGGPGTHTVPVTTTVEERAQIGEQVRRYRQSALIWCLQATVAVGPEAESRLSPRATNPFRLPAAQHGGLAALRNALDQAVRVSTAPLPGLAELTTQHELPLVEQWRQVARAAALGEHDFEAGLGLGRLDDGQLHTLIGDVAATVRALVVLDQRYDTIPRWERLDHADRLGWAALACALDASLDPPDYSIDMRGWRPKTKIISGPAKPGLLGVLQAEHNLVPGSPHAASHPANVRIKQADVLELLAVWMADLFSPDGIDYTVKALVGAAAAPGPANARATQPKQRLSEAEARLGRLDAEISLGPKAPFPHAQDVFKGGGGKDGVRGGT